jgi:uncharacterized membrane protein
MKRSRSIVALVVAVGVTVSGLAPGLPPAGAQAGAPAPRPGEVTAVDLPAGLQPAGINERGQIVALAYGSGPPQAVVVEGGAVTATVGPWEPYPHPHCPPGQCFFPAPAIPFINDRGLVATVVGGHAVLWDRGRSTDLDGDAAGSWLFDLNERGDAVVVRFTADHQVLGLWRRGAFTPIRTLPLTAFVVQAKVSERGHVMASIVVLEPPQVTRSAFVWFQGVATDLGELAPLDVNRRGQVVGIAPGPTPFDSRAAVWRDGTLTELAGLGGSQSGALAINDRGQVAGFSTAPGSGLLTTVLWDHGEVVDVGRAAGGVNQPRAINERGQVLVNGLSPAFGFFGAVWDHGRLRLLPPSNEPGVSVEPFTMNDRGQVVGRRSPSTGPAIPMLWKL